MIAIDQDIAHSETPRSPTSIFQCVSQSFPATSVSYGLKQGGIEVGGPQKNCGKLLTTIPPLPQVGGTSMRRALGLPLALRRPELRIQRLSGSGRRVHRPVLDGRRIGEFGGVAGTLSSLNGMVFGGISGWSIFWLKMRACCCAWRIHC